MKTSTSLMLLGLTASWLLAGCTTTSTNQETLDYRGISKAPVLDVPPELLKASGAVTPSSTSAAPTSAKALAEQQEAARRANNVVVVETQAVIRELGQLRYLEIDGTVPDIWSKVGDFFRSNGLIIAEQDASIGVLTTQWQENEARLPNTLLRKTLGEFLGKFLSSSGQMDQYQAIVEPAANGKVRVYIAHYGIAEEFSNASQDKTVWRYRDSEPLLVMELLKKLALILGVKTPRVDNTSAVPAAEHTKVTAAGLVLPLDINAAWEKMLLGLTNDGWSLQQLDRKAHVFMVRAPRVYPSSPATSLEASKADVRINLTAQQGSTSATFTPLAQNSIPQDALAALAATLN